MDYDIKARKDFFTIFNGKLGQVLQNDNGHEYYRRPPGVRAIIPTETGLILQKEKRSYLDREWDYRLPGGKSVDTLLEYLNLLKAQYSWPIIQNALKSEVLQEIGLVVKKMKPYHESESAATIEHTLYYFIVTDFSVSKQNVQEDEIIEKVELSYKEVWQLLLERKFSEDRTRAVLFEYMIKEKSSFII